MAKPAEQAEELQSLRAAYGTLKALSSSPGALAKHFTPANLCRPRAFFEHLGLRSLNSPGLVDHPDFDNLPSSTLDLTKDDAHRLHQVVLREVARFVTVGVAVPDRSKAERLRREAGERAARATREHLEGHRHAAAVSATVGTIARLLCLLPSIAVATIKGTQQELLEEFAVTCVPEELRDDLSEAMSRMEIEAQRLATAPTPESVVSLALTGKAEALHEAIRWAGTDAIEWPWVKTVIEAWRYAAHHAATPAERKHARENAELVGRDLVTNLTKMGRPNVEPEPQRFERRAGLVAALHEQVKAMKRQWKNARGDPNAITVQHQLTPEEFALMLDRFSSVSQGQPKAIAREIVGLRERMTGESLRSYLSGRRKILK